MNQRISYRPVFNRAARLNLSGKGLIEIECRQAGKRVYFSTHTYVEPGQWERGRIISHPLADELNHSIAVCMYDIQRIELDYLSRRVYISLQTLKLAFKDRIRPSASLTEFGFEIVRASVRKASTIEGYGTLFRNIEKFRSGLLVSDVDYSFIVAYENWMRAVGIAHNTRVGRLRSLRAIMAEAVKRKIIDENPFDNYKIPAMTSRKGFLSESQLRRLENIVLDGRAAIIRDAFLFACYTGLRFSDIVSLHSVHIVNGWIHKEMIKTGFMIDVPLDMLFGGKALAMVAKYGNIERLTGNIGCNATANKILKDVFKAAGITENYTFHTARHTFASLLLQQGIAITTVQRMLGHQKIATTQIYGEVTCKSIAADIKRANRKR